MPRRLPLLLVTLLCGASLSLAAQEPQAGPSPTAPLASAQEHAVRAGPRLPQPLPRYQPVVEREATAAAAVAADRTVITISTLGLVLLVVLLIILIS